MYTPTHHRFKGSMKRTIPHNKSLLLNTNEADSPSIQALCVRLSHKLICTNAFFGLLFLLLEKSHWLSPVISFSLMRGKCYLKNKITNRVTFHVSNPPFRTVILSYVIKKFESGRFIDFITKAGQNYAVSVAGHLKLFSKILVSLRQTILSGTD